MCTAIAELRSHLDGMSPGCCNPTTLQMLRHAWPELDGAEVTNMDASKLDRVQKLRWHPPCLSFEIERHGALVGGGSSRAEVQWWEINVDAGTARIVHATRRQVYPMDARLDTNKLATEIATAVAEGAKTGNTDPRFSSSIDALEFDINKIIPETNKATTLSRRKRFAADLDRLLEQQGWVPRQGGRRSWVYERKK